MNIMVNDRSVEKIVNAFMEALTDDPKKLTELLRVLNSEKETTGLGYILLNAIKHIQEKIDD